MSPEFEWDEAKRLANVAKHGIDFLDAAAIFALPHLEVEATLTGGESRHLAIGPLDGRLITVVFTQRGGAIRLISARRSRRVERTRYQALFH
ncbi:MAG: BrnT family toxin [Acetobacteraceae bacterium]|nr:BrnT family toxin [Acetobacteraceae bacterium]